MKEERRYIIQAAIILIAVVYLIKLFTIQVVDPQYAKAAESNIIQRIIEYPYRGLIFDRNNNLLVYNKPQYDIMVTPNEVEDLDTLAFVEVFGIPKEELTEKLMAARKYSYVKPSPIMKQLSHEEFASVQDQLVFFKGFSVQARTSRAYKYPILANALGYVSEVTKGQIERDSVRYYHQGDYIGQSGIEAYYEEQLRGRRGVKYKLKNVRGIDKGPFNEGRHDTIPIPGENLRLTIDSELQLYGEKLMKGKSGSIVAIEPSSGEILSFVSGPSYNPSMLTGRKYGENFTAISQDTLKPLFNRPLMAQYRPGSIFKIVQSLVALQEGVISTQTYFPCNMNLVGCHYHGPGEYLKGAITHSCNPYFFNVMKRVVNREESPDPFEDTKVGLANWSEHIKSFGFGTSLGIDLPGEKRGLVPTPEYYDRAYGGRPWKFSNIYSIAIGEGENLVVPLQMANFAAIMANRGYFYLPHLVKSVGESGDPVEKYKEKHFTTVEPQHFDVAVEAMAEVVKSGTGQYRAKLKDIEVCGKTGTVQNDPLPDHSVFIAFAPKENPQIALAVYVEDAGQGARSAAAIASLMIEKYLLGQTERPWIEDYVLKGDFLD
ncbi:MAG: penicillin-binding transpeptidase domain-containing protein [Candidatus Cyclobacteriaceae bacterium M2_1C_046]